jgi:hypothetical protein
VHGGASGNQLHTLGSFLDAGVVCHDQRPVFERNPPVALLLQVFAQ